MGWGLGAFGELKRLTCKGWAFNSAQANREPGESFEIPKSPKPLNSGIYLKPC